MSRLCHALCQRFAEAESTQRYALSAPTSRSHLGCPFIPLGECGAVDHVRIAYLTSGYRLIVHSLSLKKARSLLNIACRDASDVSSCRDLRIWLCRQALSSDVCVHEEPFSCPGQENPANMTHRQSHRLWPISCREYGYHVHQDRYGVRLYTRHLYPWLKPLRSLSLRSTQEYLMEGNMRRALHTYLYCCDNSYTILCQIMYRFGVSIHRLSPQGLLVAPT